MSDPASGRNAEKASADLGRLATLLDIPKECLVARAYAVILNAHSDVSDAYFAARASVLPADAGPVCFVLRLTIGHRDRTR